MANKPSDKQMKAEAREMDNFFFSESKDKQEYVEVGPEVEKLAELKEAGYQIQSVGERVKEEFPAGIEYHTIRLYFDDVGWNAECIGADWPEDIELPEDWEQLTNSFTGKYVSSFGAEIPMSLNPIGEVAWEICEVGVIPA